MQTELKRAARLGRVKPSPSLAAAARAASLRAQGHDIISVATGEPDFDTPQHIKAAASLALAQGATKYTPVQGTESLRSAICGKFLRDNGLSFEPEQIIVGVGVKQVIYNALMATVDVGDEVLVPAPYWVSYPDMVALAGGTAIPLPCPQAAGFKLQPDRLEAAITSRTRWLILNSPGNPGGAAYSAMELRALAQVLLRHPQVWVMADDIYEHLIYCDRPFVTLAQVVPALAARTLTLNGVSKAYCMTGWRIGYGAGPRELIDAMAIVQSQLITSPPAVCQAAATEALNGPQQFIAMLCARFRERRDHAAALLGQCPGLTCHLPDGAFYLYPACDGLIGRRTPADTRLRSDVDVVDYLIDSVGVVAVPGAAFGLSPHFRLTFAVATDKLLEACSRIRLACETLTA